MSWRSEWAQPSRLDKIGYSWTGRVVVRRLGELAVTLHAGVAVRWLGDAPGRRCGWSPALRLSNSHSRRVASVEDNQMIGKMRSSGCSLMCCSAKRQACRGVIPSSRTTKLRSTIV